jgi:drug/metabolite transporter (DMT)-like permease
MTARSRAEAFLLATTLVWGGTFPAMKIGLEGMSAMMLIALRFAAAGCLFLAFLSGRIFPIQRSSALKGASLGLLLFLGFVAQTVGLYYTTASKSAFITSMMVIFAPVLQYVIERRPPTVGNMAGVAVVCTGLWILTSPTGSGFNVGDALTLACSFFFGLYIVYLDVVSKEVSDVQLTFLQILTCALLGWGTVLLTEAPAIPTTPSSVIALIYLTLLATVLTTFIQTKYQKDTTPTRAAIIFTIEPVFATVFAFYILGEHVGGLHVVGGGLIIAGILLSELSDMVPVLSKAFRIPG